MQTSPTSVICKIKAAIAECRHEKYPPKHQECGPKEPQPVPMFLMIPLDDSDTGTRKEETHCEHAANAPTKDLQISKYTEELKFPEMRNGMLFTRCYCVHRNGLQDCCPLNQCQGQPRCLRKPWPNCLPAKYLQSRHPEQYPPST